MKTALFALMMVFFSMVCSCQSSLDLSRTKPSDWVSFHEQATVIQNGCTMVQRTEPSTNSRKVFIQRREEKEPVLLYAHERSVEVAIGHQGRMVLINDSFATKACKVVVADIDSGKNWRIDEQACQQYLQTAPKEWFPRHVVPEAAGFSPDDKMVLIAMKSGYVARSPEEAGRFGKSFKVWSYVVDSANGALLKAYETNGIVSRKWWQFEGGT